MFSLLLIVGAESSLPPVNLGAIPPELNPVVYDACAAYLEAAVKHVSVVESDETGAHQANPCEALNKEYYTRIVAPYRDELGEPQCSCLYGMDLADSVIPECDPGCTVVNPVIDLNNYERNMQYIDKNDSSTINRIFKVFKLDHWLATAQTTPAMKTLRKPRFGPSLEKALALVRSFPGQADEREIWFYLVSLGSRSLASRHLQEFLSFIGLRIDLLAQYSREGPFRTLAQTLTHDLNHITTGGLSIQALLQDPEHLETSNIAARSITYLAKDESLNWTDDFKTGLLLKASHSEFEYLSRAANYPNLSTEQKAQARQTLATAKNDLIPFQIPAIMAVPVGFAPKQYLACIKALQSGSRSFTPCRDLISLWADVIEDGRAQELPLPVPLELLTGNQDKPEDPLYYPVPLKGHCFDSAVLAMSHALLHKRIDPNRIQRALSSERVVRAIRRGAREIGMVLERTDQKWMGMMATERPRPVERPEASRFFSSCCCQSFCRRITNQAAETSSTLSPLQSSGEADIDPQSFISDFYSKAEILVDASPLFMVSANYHSLSKRMGLWQQISFSKTEDEVVGLMNQFFRAVRELKEISRAFSEPLNEVEYELRLMMARKEELAEDLEEFITAANSILDRGVEFYGQLEFVVDGYEGLVRHLRRGLNHGLKQSLVRGLISRLRRTIPEDVRAEVMRITSMTRALY